MSDRPVAADPLRGMRGIFVATLLMEAVVVGLALLVLDRIGGGPGGLAGWYTAGLALAMVIAACVQGRDWGRRGWGRRDWGRRDWGRRDWGLGLALTLQVAMVVGWFAHPALGGLGLLFVLVWIYLLGLRRAVARGQQPRASGDGKKR